MRKSLYLSIVLCVLFTLNLSAGTYSGGDGSEANPYQIASAADMQEIGAEPNDWADRFVLMNDIDLAQFTGTQFNIIGNITGEHRISFYGVFDGNGHSISNFTYESNDVHNIGLFSYVYYGTIKNLTLVDPNVSAGTGHNVGALVGMLFRGHLWNCSIEGGTVSGDTHVGTLLGWLIYQGEVGNCRVEGSSVSGNQSIGGLVGGSESETTNISNCSVTCTVIGNNNRVGGLIGISDSSIDNCYAAGNVLGGDLVGGLVGEYAVGTLSSCYAMSNVTGDEKVGGLIGQAHGGTVVNCYAAGVVDGNDNTGALVGYEDNQDGNFSSFNNNFWDSTVNFSLEGIGNNTDPSVTAKSTVEMMRQATFTDWDFAYIWGIAENQTYPYLKLYLPGDLDRNGYVNVPDFAIMANNWMDFSPWTKLGYQTFLDGITLLQISIQGLDDIGSNLTRMQELAHQSATGSYSAAQRTIMNAEFQELFNEIDNIAASTSYKRVRMLTGADGMSYYVNTDSVHLEINKQDMRTAALLGSGFDILTVADAQVVFDATNLAMSAVIASTDYFRSHLDSLLIILNTY